MRAGLGAVRPRTGFGRLVIGFGFVAGGLLGPVGVFMADAAAADNCSGWGDCNGVGRALLLALLGLVALGLGGWLLASAGTLASVGGGVGLISALAGLAGTITGGLELWADRGYVRTQAHLDNQSGDYENEARSEGHGSQFDAIRDAIARGAPPEEWLRHVNPTGDNNNCPQTADAVESILAGHPRVANEGSGSDVTNIERTYLTGSTPSTPDEMIRWVGEGTGRRGFVIADNGRGQHIFNVARLPDGRTVFIDGQTGRMSADVRGVLQGDSWGGTVTYRFLPTNPRPPALP